MGIFDNAKNVTINGVAIQSMKTSDGKWIYGGELRTISSIGSTIEIEVVIMGQPVANQSVDFYLNGVKKATSTTSSNGRCSVSKRDLAGFNYTNPCITYQYTAQTYIQSLGRVYSDTGSFEWYS